MQALARKYVCARVYYYSIIKPLCGPICMLKTSKIFIHVEIAGWARVWQKPFYRDINKFSFKTLLQSQKIQCSFVNHYKAIIFCATKILKCYTTWKIISCKATKNWSRRPFINCTSDT